jgi:hypothetical protein
MKSRQPGSLDVSEITDLMLGMIDDRNMPANELLGDKIRRVETMGKQGLKVIDVSENDCLSLVWGLANRGFVIVNNKASTVLNIATIKSLCAIGLNKSEIIWIPSKS